MSNYEDLKTQRIIRSSHLEYVDAKAIERSRKKTLKTFLNGMFLTAKRDRNNQKIRPIEGHGRITDLDELLRLDC